MFNSNDDNEKNGLGDFYNNINVVENHSCDLVSASSVRFTQDSFGIEPTNKQEMVDRKSRFHDLIAMSKDEFKGLASWMKEVLITYRFFCDEKEVDPTLRLLMNIIRNISPEPFSYDRLPISSDVSNSIRIHPKIGPPVE